MTPDDLSIALPLLILAIGAILTLLNGAITRNQTAGTILATLAAIGAGLWAMKVPAVVSAPSLGLAAGGLTRLFTVFFAFMTAAVLVLSGRYNAYRGIKGEEYPATLLFTAFGMVALASATNLLIIFLGLETMTFGFYLLAAIDRGRPVSSEAGLKYLLMGVVSAAFLAFGISLLYCVAGSLDLGEAVRLTLGSAVAPVALAGWACVLIGIFFKLSLVPAHLWTPDVYQAAPAPVVAFLSGGSKGAAILLLILLWTNAAGLAGLRVPLFVMALLSMLVGNLAALRQNDIRRMLAYSSIAQMGYVVVALIAFQGGGLRAAAFYAIAYGIMSLAAFGAIGVLEGSGCGQTLDDYRGRGFTHPVAGGVLAVAMFALAGIPPTAGFTGKFLIFASAIRAGEYALAIIGILTAAVSIYYYLRVVTALYLQQAAGEERENIGVLATSILGLSAAFIILLGLFPAQLLNFLKTQLP
ncbi:MAG: NADH-quinone oxidoreductase subunit N [Desulfobacterales bacterium GWB2_56_26]|nr:MAG: NADH-quinone oxidoreductase subunit N [Desulfobacterales bacterium GWB2_56_26]